MNADRHNDLARKLFTRLVDGGETESGSMVLLESIIFGVMLYYRPDPRHAAEFLDAMTARVIERLNERTKG